MSCCSLAGALPLAAMAILFVSGCYQSSSSAPPSARCGSPSLLPLNGEYETATGDAEGFRSTATSLVHWAVPTGTEHPERPPELAVVVAACPADGYFVEEVAERRYRKVSYQVDGIHLVLCADTDSWPDIERSRASHAPDVTDRLAGCVGESWRVLVAVEDSP